METPLNMNTFKIFLKKNNIYWIAGLLSILISLVMFAWQQPIDPDGFTYLTTANAYLNHGYHAAMAIYPWPFYPILLALTSKFLGLSLLSASNLLNIIFDTLTVLFFIRLLAILGGSRRIQIFGAFLILFFPYLNHFRHQILRGHGYLAFALLSLLIFIKFLKTGKLKYAIGFGLAIFAASLFRIEGIILALFVPFIILIRPNTNLHNKIKLFIKAYLIHIICFLFVVSFLLFKIHHVNDSGIWHIFGRLSEISMQFTSGLSQSFHHLIQKAGYIQQYVLFNKRLNEAMCLLISGMIGLYIYYLLNVLPLGYLILSSAAIIKRTVGTNIYSKISWAAFLIINLILSFAFFTQEFFIAERYIALLSILLLLAVPFTLDIIYQRWKEKQGKIIVSSWFFPLITLYIIVIALSSITYFGPSKTYVVKAGKWIEANTPQNIVLCHNDEQLAFYASRKNNISFDIKKTTNKPNWFNQCDYVAATITRHHKNEQKILENILSLPPIKTFKNRRGDTALIYRIKMDPHLREDDRGI